MKKDSALRCGLVDAWNRFSRERKQDVYQNCVLKYGPELFGYLMKQAVQQENDEDRMRIARMRGPRPRQVEETVQVEKARPAPVAKKRPAQIRM